MDDSNNVILFTTKIFRTFKYIPIISAMAYFIGFLIINSYLLSYGFSDNDFINIQYLISGLSFIVFVSPSILIVFLNYNNPTDDLSKNWQEWIRNLIIILYYIMLVDISIMIRYGNSTMVVYFIFAIFLTTVIIFYTTSQLAKKNLRPITRSTIQVISLLVYQIAFTIFFNNDLLWLKGIILFYGLTTLVFLGLIGDNNFNFSIIPFSLLSFIISANIFGSYVFDKLPREYGGGLPIHAKCYINKDKKDVLKAMEIQTDSPLSFTCDILYSFDDKYYIKKGDKYFLLRSDFILGVESSNVKP